MENNILINICAIFGVATAVIIICRFLKIRYIIGYLITGVLLSPHTSDYFAKMEEVDVYAEIGIILLLFTIGLEFSFGNLKKIRNYVLGGGTAQIIFTILLTAALIYIFKRPSWEESIFWGFLYALSSTAIVIKILQDSNSLTSPHGKFILAVLIFQDIMIVPLMLFTPILAGAGGNLFEAFGWLFGKLVLMGGVAFVLTRFFIPYLLKTIMKVQSQEVFLIALIFIVTAIALLTEQLGLSFISMGMLLNYEIFLTDFGWILFWIVFAFMVKAIAGILAVRVMGLGWKTAFAVGFSIAQIGEFSFVLAQSGLKYELISGTNYQIFLAVSIILMSITPFIVTNAEKIYPLINKYNIKNG